MEENQDLNNVVVDNTVPAAEPVPTEVPETPAPEVAPVEAAPVEVPVEQPVEVPVEATPVVEQAPVEVPVEATPVTPVVEEVAPVEEATPVETPVAEPAPVEAAPVEVPAEAPAAEVAPVEAVPVDGPVVEVVQDTPAIGEATPELPVVEPAPAVNEMPETPTDAPAVDATVTPEAPVEGAATAAPTEEKKSKTGLILIVILLLVAVGAAVYFFLIKGKDEPAPKPVENNTVVERAAKYFKDGNNELTLYSDDNTYVLVLNGSTYTGTFNATSTEITFNGGKEYRTEGCNDVTGLTFILQVNEDGTYAGTEGMVSGVSFSEVSKGDVAAFTETECIAPATPEENTTTPEENTTTEEPATVAVENVTLDVTEKTLKVNETFTLVATVTPEDATNKAVEWSSADKKIATVDKNGKVKAVKAGTVKITVKTKDGGKKATCSVTVQADETAATNNTTSDETALNKPNCTYDVTKVNTEGSSQYNKFKSSLNTKGQNVGTESAQGCKSLSDIIADVKAAVKAEAEKCWKDEYVTKAVESAECKLTPGCDKTSKYGTEAKYDEDKKDSIVKIWTNPTWNCAKTEEDYKL